RSLAGPCLSKLKTGDGHIGRRPDDSWGRLYRTAKKGGLSPFRGYEAMRECEEACRKADVLIHEATFAKGDRELAGDYYHSTSEQAAETAREACAKTDLTHISARYQGKRA
ncbi:ribonuclease Z, partial [Bacillus licheniformis]|nr:ribonuclease Z [Bacillus licheniformis]